MSPKFKFHKLEMLNQLINSKWKGSYLFYTRSAPSINSKWEDSAPSLGSKWEKNSFAPSLGSKWETSTWEEKGGVSKGGISSETASPKAEDGDARRKKKREIEVNCR